jgi:hypothetical protein
MAFVFSYFSGSFCTFLFFLENAACWEGEPLLDLRVSLALHCTNGCYDLPRPFAIEANRALTQGNSFGGRGSLC